MDEQVFGAVLQNLFQPGLTCVKLFVETDPTNSKDKQRFLQKSKVTALWDWLKTLKEHFLEEVKQIQDNKSDNFLSFPELNKYIKRIKLQEEITTFLEGTTEKNDDKGRLKWLSIFGTKKHRCGTHPFENCCAHTCHEKLHHCCWKWKITTLVLVSLWIFNYLSILFFLQQSTS